MAASDALVVAEAKDVGVKALPNVSRAVVGYDDAHTEQLKRLEMGVRALVATHYKSGLRYPSPPLAVSQVVEDFRTFVHERVRSLRRAVGAFEGSEDYLYVASALLQSMATEPLGALNS